MKPIWVETYGNILSPQHLEYLLQKYFSMEGVQTYRNLGYQYRKIDNVGVLVYVDKGAVEIRVLQAEGGKRMAAPDYFRGHPLEA